MVGQLDRLERVGDQRSGRGKQGATLEFSRQAHPVIGRQRIRAGVADHPVDIEPDEAVADPGTRPRHGQLTDIREGALREHVQQGRGTVQVGRLQTG